MFYSAFNMRVFLSRSALVERIQGFFPNQNQPALYSISLKSQKS